MTERDPDAVARAIVTGHGGYVRDLELDGMMHARILRSPYARARIRRVDASAVPEHAVALTPDDVRGLGRYGCQIKDQTVLAIEEVRFCGDPVAAVAGLTERDAEEALTRIDVEYEALPPVLDPFEALSAEAPLVNDVRETPGGAAYFGVRPEAGTNVCHRFRLSDGDVERGFKEADVVVEQTYRTAGAQQVAMEPHASIARWVGDHLELWSATQTPFNVREDLAGLFGIAPESIRIICPPIGGSFGAKTFVRVEAIAAALARQADRPVKVVLDRDEAWLLGSRHPAVMRVALGARADGTLVAKRVECWADTGAYADCGPGVVQKMGFTAAGPYRIPNVLVDAKCVYTNQPPNGAFRGYGATQVVWASERAMDLLAARLGLDPLELRLKNVLVDGDRYCTGEEMHDVHFTDCLRAAAEAIGWSQNSAGKGICVFMKGMQTPSRAAIAVEADEDGGYLLRCATVEMGQGARRALALEAARLLDVDASRIRFPDPDTDAVPFDTRTTSSRSTYMMSGALVEAVGDLQRSGGRRGVGEFRNEGGLDPETGKGIASSHWHQGAAAAEIRLDEETGKVDVQRIHAAVYAGRVVNRPGAELQNEGSMIMGLGTALFEEIACVDGQVTNANLSDYEIPSTADLPEMTYELLEREGAEVHGLGETAVPPVPAAIGNALGSLGVEVTDLPFTPEVVLTALDRRRMAAAS